MKITSDRIRGVYHKVDGPVPGVWVTKLYFDFPTSAK